MELRYRPRARTTRDLDLSIAGADRETPSPATSPCCMRSFAPPPAALDIGFRSIDQHLPAALETLEAHAIAEIADLQFQDAADLSSRTWQHGATMEEMVGFVERLLPLAFRTFRRLVAHNFPSMAGDFFSIAQQPLFGIGQVDVHHADPGWWYVTLFLCVPDAGAAKDRFVFRERRFVETRIVRDKDPRIEVCLDGEWRRRVDTGDLPASLVQRHLRLASVFRPSYDYLDRHQLQAPATVQPVLRALVYDLIRNELPTAFAQLCRRHGAKLSDRDWMFFDRARNEL